MTKFIRIILLSIFLLLELAVLPQTKPEKEFLVSPSGDTVTINAYSLAQIPGNLENTAERLNKIEENLIKDNTLKDFDSIYNKAVNTLKKNRDQLQGDKSYSSMLVLRDKMVEWETHKANVDVWKNVVRERIQKLDNNSFEVEVLLSIWNKTRGQMEASGVSADVMTTLEDMISRSEQVKREIIATQNDVLRKQNDLTELSLMIDDVLRMLEEKRNTIQSEFLRQDSPPLWAAPDTTSTLSFALSTMRDSIDDNISNLRGFVRFNDRQLILQLIVFLLLWLMFFLLDREAAKIEEKEDQQKTPEESRNFISYHFAAALIIALITSIWIFPAAISAVTNLIRLTYILIGLFILPKFFDKRMTGILLLMLLLLIVDIAQSWLIGKTLYARLILIAELLLTAWILYQIIRKKGFIAEAIRLRKWNIVFRIVPVLYLFLIISFISVIAGFSDLASLMGKTAANATINLTVLVLLIMVMQRLLEVLLSTRFIQASHVIANHQDTITKRGTQLIRLFGLLLWIRSVFIYLNIYEPTYNWLTEASKTSWEIGTTSIEVGNIINFILVIFFTVFIFRLIRVILNEDIFPRVILPRGVPGTITTVVTYLIVGYGFYLAIGAAGVDLGQFGLIAGALGVGIGFGLQGIVANFIAGLVLAFERPIQVGDEIQLEMVSGKVTKIGVRSTTVKTYDGSEVIIPNSDLITKGVTNWTLSDRRKRRDILVYAAYGSNPHEVMELMVRVANEHTDVLKVPAPWPLFEGFGDSSLNFRLRIWTTMDTGITVKSDVTMKIYDAMAEAGIEIPFPQRDLHIRSMDPSINPGEYKSSKPAAKRKNIPKNKSSDDS